MSFAVLGGSALRTIRYRALLWAGVLGALSCAVVVLLDPVRGWSGALTAALFGIQITVGAAFFLALQGVASAGWWFPLGSAATRIAGGLTAPGVLLLAVVTLGLPSVYEWARAHHGAPGHGAMPADKAAWLSAPFFIARAAAILVIWMAAIGRLARRAREAAAGGGAPERRALTRTSAMFLLVAAPTLTLAFFDWGMSLEPAWTSTVYGVYGFGGALQGALAAIVVATVWLRGPGAADERVRHNLGKLLFGFSMFWAYIWVMQYLLIWYANLPEEVPYYLRRQSGDWAPLFWVNPVLCFAVPFFALLSARAKRHPGVLLQVAVVVLAGRWLDTYLLVAPATSSSPAFPLAGLGATAALLAAAAVLAVRSAARTAASAARADTSAATTPPASAPARRLHV